MKKIALFGGSGRTGFQFLQRAVAAGYTVRCLVRNPAKLNFAHPAVEVLKGDVLDYDDVLRTVSGTDIVVSLFGHVKNSPSDVQTEGTRHIVQAMKATNVQRIISLSGGGLPFPEKDQPGFISGVMKLLMPQVLKDAEGHYKVLRESGLEWMVARGPRLTDGPHTGKYRVGWVGVNSGIKISRADLADFILKQVENTTYTFQMPFVTS